MASDPSDSNAPDKSTAAPSSFPLSHVTTPPLKTLVHRVSAAAKATGSAIGIPGLSDMAHMIGEPPKVSSGLESELADFGAYLEDLLRVVDPDFVALQHEPSYPSRNLKEILMGLNSMLKDKRPLSAMLAHRQLEDYERLSRQANYVLNQLIVSRLSAQEMAIQELRLETTGHLESLVKIASELKQSFLPPTHPLSPELDGIEEDTLPTVDLDAFVQQGVPHSYIQTGRSYRNWRLLFDRDADVHRNALPNEEVRVTCTPGMVGRVQVIRKTYISSSTATAIKCARRDLSVFLKYSHPNVARLKGVIKDSAGRIRELVFTAASKPCQEFLAWVTEPAAFVRFLRCMHEVHTSYPGNDFEVLVDSYGHVTAVPNNHYRSSWKSYLILRFLPMAALCPTFRALINLLYERRYNWIFDQEQLVFLDKASRLEQGFTDLDVLRVAQDANMKPLRRDLITDYRQNEPPHVIIPAGISIIGASGFAQLSPRETGTKMIFGEGFKINRYNMTISPASDAWYSVMLESGFLRVLWTEYTPDIRWNTFVCRAKRLSELRGAPLEKFCTFSSISCHISVENTRSDGTISIPVVARGGASSSFFRRFNLMDDFYDHNRHVYQEMQVPVYFHRRPSSSSPREYWGFFSTMPDPHADCPEFPRGTNKITYAIEGYGYDASQDYGVRYDKMVAKGLKSMPGSWGS